MPKFKFNFIVFPYRDLHYQKRYGQTVRDLQIIKSLENIDEIDSVYVVNRPVSLYERIFGKKKILCDSSTKITYWQKSSFDIYGPLKKRLWTENAYKPHNHEYIKYLKSDENIINVLLDFTPIAAIDYNLFKNCVIWYDLIDNFIKHNRFSQQEKSAVYRKYSYVESEADLITGVSPEALSQFSVTNKFVIANGVSALPKSLEISPNQYCFGFIGFISNKFDIDFIECIANELNSTVAIWGKVLSREVRKKLQGLKNVYLFGEFSEKDIPRIMPQFKVGLLPYKKILSHDESPLKLYIYKSYGKPIVSTNAYDNVSDDWFHLYNGSENLKRFLIKFLSCDQMNPFEIPYKIQCQLDVGHFYDTKVRLMLNIVQNIWLLKQSRSVQFK